MPSVTIDLVDLESLLFALSGISDLEKGVGQVTSALDQRKRNPIATGGAKGILAGAHDRLSAAWRRAKRDAEWPARIVSEGDIAELWAMFRTADGGVAAYVILDRYPMHFVQDLLLVESGPCWDGYQIAWPAPAGPEFHMRHASGQIRYGARLTHYGRQVLGVNEADMVRPDAVFGLPLLGLPPLKPPGGQYHEDPEHPVNKANEAALAGYVPKALRGPEEGQ